MYNRSQSGYALAEVLLATVVISISVVELSRALSNLNRVAIVASAIAKAGNQAHAAAAHTTEGTASKAGDGRGGMPHSIHPAVPMATTPSKTSSGKPQGPGAGRR